MDAEVVSAEVRQRDDGECELFVVFNIDADPWDSGRGNAVAVIEFTLYMLPQVPPAGKAGRQCT